MLCYVDDESYLHLLLYLRWGMISVAVAGLKEACSHKRKKKKRYLCFYCCNKHAICMAQTRCYQHLYVGAYLAGLVYQSSVNCNTKQVDISDLKCIYCFLLGINCEQLLFKSH